MVAAAIGAADLTLAQGPVREGLRRAGEATANVARGVADATVGVAQTAGSAVGLTPATPYQARGGAGFDTGRDARWRFAQHNGEWWYYNDNNQWQYHRDGQWQTFSQDQFQPANQQLAQDQQIQHGQQHSAAYRGMDQGQMHHGMNQQIRHDHQGRAYICDNGHAVYLEQQQQQQGFNQQHGVARQDLDQQQMNQQAVPGQPTPATPQQPADATIQSDAQSSVQGDASLQSAPSAGQPAASSAVPATPSAGGQISGDGGAEVSIAPAGPVTSSQAQGDPAAPREINNNPTSQTNGATENPGR
jgi:hypothetical protein